MGTERNEKQVLSFRMDKELVKKWRAYISATPGATAEKMGASAIREYMANHPLQGIEMDFYNHALKAEGVVNMANLDYVECELEKEEERLENQTEDWVEERMVRELETVLMKEEPKELEYASEKMNLKGAALEAHMKKFRKKTEAELKAYFRQQAKESIKEMLEEYRYELESEEKQ